MAAKDACVASHVAGFDSRTTKYKYRLFLAILVHPYWGFYHFVFSVRVFMKKFKSCNLYPRIFRMDCELNLISSLSNKYVTNDGTVLVFT